jgi:hypothetical protein
MKGGESVNDLLVNTKTAAHILDTSDGMLSYWRKTIVNGETVGPKYEQNGSHFFYRISELIRWSEVKQTEASATHQKVVDRANLVLKEKGENNEDA